MLYVPSYMSSAVKSCRLEDDTQSQKSSEDRSINSKSNRSEYSKILPISPHARLQYLQQQTQSNLYHKNLKSVHKKHRTDISCLSSKSSDDRSSPPLILENLLTDSNDEKLPTASGISSTYANETPWIMRRAVRFDSLDHRNCENAFCSHDSLYTSYVSHEKDGYPGSSDVDSDSNNFLTPVHITKNPPPPYLKNINDPPVSKPNPVTLKEPVKSDVNNKVILKRSSSRRLLKKRQSTYSFKRYASLKLRGKSDNENNMECGELFSTSSVLSMRPEIGPDEASDCDACQRITLNVSGMKFETWNDILSQHPTTLLGNPEKRAKFYDPKTCEYFFDRHRPTFEAIFHYFQYGGKLKRPPNIPDDIFIDELLFYEIEPEVISLYKQGEGYAVDTLVLPENKYKRIIWELFEMPETSFLAYMFAIISVIFTITTIVLFCVETLPVFSESHCEKGEKPNFLDPFFIIETMCTLWFTIEIVARFICCPSKKAYMLDVKNYVDFAAIIPYYSTLFTVLATMSCERAKSSASLAFLRVIRLIRVFKLTKHSAGLQVLVLTFKASIEGLGLFLVALIVCIIVFSSAIYYAEMGVEKSKIHSIPDAFWWAVITMCTVGYGDKYPQGIWGKLIGSICAVAGVLTLAIPVPIITENFNKFYTHKTGRGRH